MLVAKPVRTHFSGTPFPAQGFWRENYPSGTGDSKDFDFPAGRNTLESESYALGWINTEYKYRLSKGMLIQPTPWFQYTSSYEHLSGLCDFHNSTIRQWCIPATPFTYWFMTHPDGKPDRLTLVKRVQDQDTSYFVQAAAAKIYSSGWDTLTFTAELSKTFAMFRGILSRLTQLAKEGKLERMWLESRYGWRTLIFDLEDMNKALRQLNGERKRFVERTGSKSSSIKDTTVQFTGSSNFNAQVRVIVEETLSLRGHVIADISPPDLAFNPLTTAWELARLSFVVDWVVNVGQFLESLSFLVLQREHYASGGVSISQTATVSGDVYLWKNGMSGVNFFNAKWTATCVERRPQSVSTIPQLRLRLDWLKSLDLISLFIQALRR